jgi:hypothetical protein
MKFNKKKLLFLFAISFTLLMLYLAYDMAKRTVKPWDRKKNNVLKKYGI